MQIEALHIDNNIDPVRGLTFGIKVHLQIEALHIDNKVELD